MSGAVRVQLPIELHHNKVVRDLAFVVQSPVIASRDDDPVAQWCISQTDESADWLVHLDAEPAPLIEWLKAQHNRTKLGVYYAALVEFYVRNCPSLGAKNVITNTQIAELSPGSSERVIGTLKLIFQDADGLSKRLESCINFFMHVGSDNFLTLQGECLHSRLLGYGQKLSVLRAPAVTKWLEEQGHRDVTQMCMLKGSLLLQRKAFVTAGDSLGGLQSATGGANAGWWTQDVQELVASTSSRFCITSKMHWLSPARVRSGVIQGQGGFLEDCPVLTAESFQAAVRSWLLTADSKHELGFKPLPIIELFIGADGELQEKSRGFVVHPNWKYAREAAPDVHDCSSCFVRGSHHQPVARTAAEENTTLLELFVSGEHLDAHIFLSNVGLWAEQHGIKLAKSRLADAALVCVFRTVDRLPLLLIDCILSLCQPPFAAENKAAAFFLLRTAAAAIQQPTRCTVPRLRYTGPVDSESELLQQLLKMHSSSPSIQRTVLQCASVLKIDPRPPAVVRPGASLQQIAHGHYLMACEGLLQQPSPPAANNSATEFACSIEVLVFFRAVCPALPVKLVSLYLVALVQLSQHPTGKASVWLSTTKLTQVLLFQPCCLLLEATSLS